MASNPPNGRPNGFKIRTTSDLAAAVGIAAVVVGGIAWGIKLEARNDALSLRTAAIERAVSSGILPRADERLRSSESKDREHDARLDRIEDRLNNHEKP